jgi:hypothetical protein
MWRWRRPRRTGCRCGGCSRRTRCFELLLCNARHVKHVPGRKTDVKDASWLCAAARGRAVARLASSRRRRSAAAGGHPLPQAAGAAAHLGGPAGREDPRGRGGQARVGRLVDADQVGPGDDRGADRRGTRPRVLAELAKAGCAPRSPSSPALWTAASRTTTRCSCASCSTTSTGSTPPSTRSTADRGDDRTLGRRHRAAADHPRGGTAHRRGHRGRDRRRHVPLPHPPAPRLVGGLCPGHNESGGKRRSGRTTHGDVWLADALTEAAWAAIRTKDTYLQAKFWRVAGPRADSHRKRPRPPSPSPTRSSSPPTTSWPPRRDLPRPRRRLLRQPRQPRTPPRPARRPTRQARLRRRPHPAGDPDHRELIAEDLAGRDWTRRSCRSCHEDS